MIKDYKEKFIQFLISHGSLKFGRFTLKSGRISPYFLNTGMLHSGEALTRLGQFYARAIVDHFPYGEFDVIFGPAYKGIPLSIATVSALHRDFQIDVSYSFNRKEPKGHGDKGLLVGKKAVSGDRILIVDDVITAGTAIRESLRVLNSFPGVQIPGVVVSVDRMEKGINHRSAIQEITREFGMPVHSVVNIREIMEYLGTGTGKEKKPFDPDILRRMEEYREKYGAG